MNSSCPFDSLSRIVRREFFVVYAAMRLSFKIFLFQAKRQEVQTKKNSSNEMNQFQGIFSWVEPGTGYFLFFEIFMENIQEKFHEIHLFDFTSFLT